MFLPRLETYKLPDGPIVIPRGVLMSAASPTPSVSNCPSPDPANVNTSPSGVIIRIL